MDRKRRLTPIGRFLAAMTPRQRQVYELIVSDAMCPSDIARLLGIDYQTVKTHTYAIYNVTGMSTRLELAVQYWKMRMEER